MIKVEELKNIIEKDLKKINYDITKEYEFLNRVDDFKQSNKHNFIYIKDGFFISESIDYEYYNSKIINKKTRSLDEFLYYIYSNNCYRISRNIFSNYKSQTVDIERIIDIKELELLKTIDEKYYKNRLQYLLNTLKEIPDLYNDDYGDNFDFSLLGENDNSKLV